LNAIGSNEIRVQGIQESWVIGKAEALAAFLRERQKFLTTTFQKYGLNVNFVLFVAAIILLPDLSVSRRFVFMILVVGILLGIAKLHSQFIPNALIRLPTSKPTLIERIWPQTFSWLATVGAAVVGAIIYGFLKGDLHFHWLF
jgi:hypothetical protein